MMLIRRRKKEDEERQDTTSNLSLSRLPIDQLAPVTQFFLQFNYIPKRVM